MEENMSTEISRKEREANAKIEMQKALDHAWENAGEKEKQFQNELFPEGKPSIEKFIKVMAKQAQKN